MSGKKRSFARGCICRFIENLTIHGDMMNVARSLPDGCAQSIIVDPPYNIGKDFGNDSDKQEMETYLA